MPVRPLLIIKILLNKNLVVLIRLQSNGNYIRFHFF